MMMMMMMMMICRVRRIIPPLSSEVSHGKVQRTAPVRVGHRKSLWFGGEAGEVAMVIDIILFFLVWRC